MRAKIAALLGDLAKTPGFNASLLIEEMISMVDEESESK